MTSHDVRSTRRVALNWPTGDPTGIPLDAIEAAFAAWVTEARNRGCPRDARCGFATELGMNRPSLIVQWDASQDVTTPPAEPGPAVDTHTIADDPDQTITWLCSHGYEATRFYPAPGQLPAPVFFALPGEVARMAFPGSTLTWDGERVTVGPART